MTEHRFDAHPAARPWHDRLTTDRAIEYAEERISEWSYEQDPHGYCHTRPMLIRLVEAAKHTEG